MAEYVDDDTLIRRALAAWYRTGGIEQPSEHSHVEEVAGLKYVVLRKATEILAAYRIMNSGALKRLRRLPADMIQY